MPIPALALSFDLIGFGEADSAVLVRDVQLLSDLLAHDDAVSTAEDTPVHIDVMGNDEIGVSTGVQPVLVAGPQHGSVVLNADGSFSYSPEANGTGQPGATLREGRRRPIAARYCQTRRHRVRWRRSLPLRSAQPAPPAPPPAARCDPWAEW